MTRTATYEGWRIEWSGGRLANIYLGDACVECMQVVDYDWQTGHAGPLRQPLRNQLRRWVRQHGAEYAANMGA